MEAQHLHTLFYHFDENQFRQKLIPDRRSMQSVLSGCRGLTVRGAGRGRGSLVLRGVVFVWFWRAQTWKENTETERETTTDRLSREEERERRRDRPKRGLTSPGHACGRGRRSPGIGLLALLPGARWLFCVRMGGRTLLLLLLLHLLFLRGGLSLDGFILRLNTERHRAGVRDGLTL